MKYIKILILTTLICLAFASLQAQDSSKLKWRVDLQNVSHLIAIDAGSLGVYHKVNLRPGLQLGVDYNLKTKKNSRTYALGSLGLRYMPYEERTASLSLQIAKEYKIYQRFLIGLRGGLNFSAVKSSDLRYTYENQKWIQTKNTDPLFLRAMWVNGLDLGYRIIDGPKPLDIFVHGDVNIGGPYSIKSGAPFWAWKMLGLTLRRGF